MQLGHLVPLGEIGGDPDTVRDYAQGLEALGYDFMEAPDHVLGANAGSRPGWEAGRNTSDDLFYDPFVLLWYVTGIRPETEFCHRGADRCATADRAGCETGRLSRRAVQGPLPAWHRRRLE